MKKLTMSEVGQWQAFTTVCRDRHAHGLRLRDYRDSQPTASW
jgi:hypothetical protein